jgi:nitrite reductase (NADH) small subunit/3-phenylpropionate/trans-cinnamate dioxygenase ferredoxin subunit
MSDGRFVPLAKTGCVPPGGATSIVVENKVIALFRQGDEYFAISDICPHMGASLAEGHVENGIVTCPWHAWRFRVCDGTWCDNPVIKTDAYELRVVGDEIQIRLAEE